MKQIALLHVTQLPAEHRCACEIEHCAAPACPRQAAATPGARRAAVMAVLTLVWMTLVGLCAAIACTARIQMLKYEIRSNERYLDMAAREGIFVGETVDEWRWQLHDMRRKLRELEA